jgi:hypothetical protein
MTVLRLLRPRGAPVFWAEFPQKIWVNYGIGWSGVSEASDANLLLVGVKQVTQTTLQRSGLQKYGLHFLQKTRLKIALVVSRVNKSVSSVA